MVTYILEQDYQKNQSLPDLERKLKLLTSCIKAFINKPEDLEKYGDLILKKAEIERKILLLQEPTLNFGECSSPDWFEIRNNEDKIRKLQDLKLELELIRGLKKRKHVRRQKNYNFDILTVVEKARIEVKRGFILCPFHNERNPSLRIYPQTNTFYCFGCGKWGTAKDLADALGVKL